MASLSIKHHSGRQDTATEHPCVEFDYEIAEILRSVLSGRVHQGSKRRLGGIRQR